MIDPMSEERPGVIGSLPSTRPHRRSDRRQAPAPDAQPPPSAAPRKPAVKSRKPAVKASPAVEKAAPPAAAPRKAAAKARKPAANAAPQPTATPRRPTAKKPPANIRSRRPAPPVTSPPPPREPVAAPAPAPDHPGMAQTLVQAAAELTEIGLKASARALRGTVSRLPKP
jgi:hypothetical protein